MRSVKLCMMIASIELYMFVKLTVWNFVVTAALKRLNRKFVSKFTVKLLGQVGFRLWTAGAKTFDCRGGHSWQVLV